MASQQGRISGLYVNPNLLRRAQIESQAPLLFRNKQIEYQKDLQDKQIAQSEAQLNLSREELELARKRQKAQEEADRTGLGLSVGKLGLNLALNSPSTTIGQKVSGTVPTHLQGGPEAALFKSAGTPSPTNAGGLFSTNGLLGNLSVGNTLVPGLAGFGVGSIFGGKKKKPLKSAAIGAGAGLATSLLTSFLGGGGFGSLSSNLFSGLSGGLGGLGSSFF